jgi:hypothetical protein
MQVRQIVRSSADVLTITRLSPGDCYKRVEDGYSEPTLKFGVVQSVMNNGEDAAVTALEYEVDYTVGAKARIRVFNGGKPAAIFPATPEEVTTHLAEIRQSTQQAVERAERDLTEKRAALAAVEALTASVGTLSAPATTSGVIDAPQAAAVDDED